jgi:hypothetical protein
MNKSYKHLLDAMGRVRVARSHIAQNRGLEKEQAREGYEYALSEDLAPALKEAMVVMVDELDSTQLLKLASIICLTIEKVTGKPNDLTPPDLKRCQVEARSFMTLGPGMTRCDRKPTVIVIEKVAGKDGKYGSMSMCDDCLTAFKTRFGTVHHDFKPITAKAPKNPKIASRTRSGVLLSISEAKRLHDEANSMLVVELRSFGKRYFNREWTTNAGKKTIANGFRKELERFLADNGEQP